MLLPGWNININGIKHLPQIQNAKFPILCTTMTAKLQAYSIL